MCAQIPYSSITLGLFIMTPSFVLYCVFHFLSRGPDAWRALLQRGKLVQVHQPFHEPATEIRIKEPQLNYCVSILLSLRLCHKDLFSLAIVVKTGSFLGELHKCLLVAGCVCDASFPHTRKQQHCNADSCKQNKMLGSLLAASNLKLNDSSKWFFYGWQQFIEH